MTLIEKNVKVYVYADTPITLLEGGDVAGTDVTAPSRKNGNVKDYYGDLKQPQQDLKFQPASIVGTTTGKTGVFEKTLYYQVIIENMVDRRTTQNGFLGFDKAGLYEKVPWYGWASSADITDSETVGLEKANKRTDQASIEDIKKANASNNPNVSVTAPKTDLKTSTTQPDSGKKSNTILYVGIGVIVIVAGVVTYFYFKKKKQQVLPVEQNQVPVPTMLY